MLLSRLEYAARQAGLADDGRESADGNFAVHRDWNCDRSVVRLLLVDVMVSFAMTDKSETIVF